MDANGYAWSDGYAWSGGYAWSDGYAWSGGYAWSDAYAWSAADVSVNAGWRRSKEVTSEIQSEIHHRFTDPRSALGFDRDPLRGGHGLGRLITHSA
jgi:hypothetical protein